MKSLDRGDIITPLDFVPSEKKESAYYNLFAEQSPDHIGFL